MQSVYSRGTTVKAMTQLKCASGWINKMCYAHKMESYPATKKEQNADTCNGMDEPQKIMLSEGRHKGLPSM